ncbi:MAG: preprotein translocase subunit SecE [Puniceicoccales bacterium]|jgi:preprotein translocase SecE subunit|nr:preprotein translocase subunit SecE [Puniceicoccales bacterium]
MNPFVKFKHFFSEIAVELKKSTWPTGGSLRQSTAIVVVAMFLFGTYVSVLDFSFFHVIKLAHLMVR